MNKNKFITSAKAKKTKNTSLFTFIIIADNTGYRMKSHGATPLISIHQNKLIDIQIDAIKTNFSNYEIILCCGTNAEKVHKYIQSKYSDTNIRIVENQLCNNSNSCEAARIALNNTNNNKVYIIDGHLMLNKEIFSTKSDKSYVYRETVHCENIDIGINVSEQGLIEHFSYGAKKQWSEIVYLHNKDIIDALRKIISTIDFKQKFIFEALNELIKRNYKFECISNCGTIEKINNIKTYHVVRGKK